MPEIIIDTKAAVLQSEQQLKAVQSAIDRAGYRALNKLAAQTHSETSRQIRSAVRLTREYLSQDSRLTVKLAQADESSAYVVARMRSTRLATYGANQLTKPAKRAKGDPLRGIDKGRKQAGVSVAVLRKNQRKPMRGAFLVPLRNSNGLGIFLRLGPGRKNIKHLYGPSVHQVFKWVMPEVEKFAQSKGVELYQSQLAYEMSRR